MGDRNSGSPVPAPYALCFPWCSGGRASGPGQGSALGPDRHERRAGAHRRNLPNGKIQPLLSQISSRSVFGTLTAVQLLPPRDKCRCTACLLNDLWLRVMGETEHTKSLMEADQDASRLRPDRANRMPPGQAEIIRTEDVDGRPHPALRQLDVVSVSGTLASVTDGKMPLRAKVATTVSRTAAALS